MSAVYADAGVRRIEGAVLDHLGIPRATVVGTSRGGLVAMFMAATVKDRLADRDAWAERPNFVVALDGEPIARASAHGGWVEWYPCAD